MTIRINKSASGGKRAQSIFDRSGAASSHSSGQSVGVDRMLKKYGTGWQTRMVRAQRS